MMTGTWFYDPSDGLSLSLRACDVDVVRGPYPTLTYEVMRAYGRIEKVHDGSGLNATFHNERSDGCVSVPYQTCRALCFVRSKSATPPLVGRCCCG